MKKLNIARVRDAVAQDPRLTIALLEQVFGYERHWIRERFKRVYAMQLTTFVRRARVELAQRLLLQEPVISVKEIARLVGWKVLDSLIRHFRAITGETPGQWRARHGIRRAYAKNSDRHSANAVRESVAEDA